MSLLTLTTKYLLMILRETRRSGIFLEMGNALGTAVIKSLQTRKGSGARINDASYAIETLSEIFDIVPNDDEAPFNAETEMKEIWYAAKGYVMNIVQDKKLTCEEFNEIREILDSLIDAYEKEISENISRNAAKRDILEMGNALIGSLIIGLRNRKGRNSSHSLSEAKYAIETLSKIFDIVPIDGEYLPAADAEHTTAGE